MWKQNDTSNRWGKWNHLQITQENMKSRIDQKKKKKKNGYIGPCTHISESTNVKVQTYFTRKITLHVAQIVSTIKKKQPHHQQHNNNYMWCNGPHV